MSDENTAADLAADDNYDDDAYFNQIANGVHAEKSGQDLPEPDEKEPETEEQEPQEAAEQQGDEAKAEKAEDKPEPVDWQARYRDLEHRYKSDEGRVNAYQKQIDDLKKQVQSAPKPKIESLEKAREDLPEFATAIEDALARQREELEASFNERLTPLQQAQQESIARAEQAELQANIEKVRAEHPDYQDYNRNTNKEFDAWLSAQPDAVQNLYDSPKAADAAYLLRSYKAAQGQRQGDAAASPSDATRSKQARLERTRMPPTKSGGVSGGTFSEDEYFNRVANKTYRENYQR